MKTVLEELIEKWESEIGSYIPNAPIYKAFIEDAKMFLEKEKEQIISAYEQDLYGGLVGHKKYLDGLEYFEDKYKNVSK